MAARLGSLQSTNGSISAVQAQIRHYYRHPGWVQTALLTIGAIGILGTSLAVFRGCSFVCAQWSSLPAISLTWVTLTGLATGTGRLTKKLFEYFASNDYEIARTCFLENLHLNTAQALSPLPSREQIESYQFFTPNDVDTLMGLLETYQKSLVQMEKQRDQCSSRALAQAAEAVHAFAEDALETRPHYTIDRDGVVHFSN